METLSAHFFSWKQNAGTADASDLGFGTKVPSIFRVAGNRETVTFVSYAVDVVDGELQSMAYVSTCGRFRVTVLND